MTGTIDQVIEAHQKEKASRTDEQKSEMPA
jgi:hypothetical protein